MTLVSDYIIAFGIVVSVTVIFIALEKNVRHWFVLPAMACGLLTGPDIIRWIRGALDAYEPKALMSFTVFYGWFVAPLLHGYWDIFAVDLNFTGDFRHWLGVAAALNAIGLICFQLIHRWVFKRTADVGSRWEIIPGRIWPAVGFFGVIGACAQIMFYIRMFQVGGGGADLNRQGLKGAGWMLMLGDPVPLLIIIGFILWSRVPVKNRSWLLISLVLFFGGVVQLVWSGLRGSRSAFVGAMFREVGVVHFFWRRFRPVHLLIGVAILIPFLYFYGFYKSAGLEGLKALESAKQRARLERKTGRTLETVLLADLARADVQARIANEIIERNNKYQLRHGKTYLVALSMLVPYAVWDILLGGSEFRDQWGKSSAFAEIYLGKTSRVAGFEDDPKTSTRVFGLTGEAMLNFGLAGVPVAWILYGFLMGWVRRKMVSLPEMDSRLAFLPCLIGPIMGLPTGDLENFLFTVIKGGTVIFLCTLFWSRRVR